MTDATEFLIWSHEHRAWWKPARWGYTGEIDKAGRYTPDDALSICENACYRWLRGDRPAYGDLPAEVMIPAALAGVPALTVRAAIEAATDAVVEARNAKRPIAAAFRVAARFGAVPVAEVVEGCTVRSAGWWCTVARVERPEGFVTFTAASGDSSTWPDDATVLVRAEQDVAAGSGVAR